MAQKFGGCGVDADTQRKPFGRIDGAPDTVVASQPGQNRPSAKVTERRDFTEMSMMTPLRVMAADFSEA
jgi:hypothetical protein